MFGVVEVGSPEDIVIGRNCDRCPLFRASAGATENITAPVTAARPTAASLIRILNPSRSETMCIAGISMMGMNAMTGRPETHRVFPYGLRPRAYHAVQA